MNRRGFLGAILAAGAAPAIVKASSLMPLWVPRASPYDVIVPIGPVDMNFYSSDLTLSVEEFSNRYLIPAMRVLSEQIDADMLRVLSTTV